MVNSKKMSKSAFAVIVLAVLLVLSMVLGLTGAWFTDTKSGSTSVTFGTVTLGTYTATSTVTNLLPGKTITVADASYTGSVAAYYRVTISCPSAKNKSGTAFTGSDLTTLQAQLQKSEVYGYVPAGSSTAQTISVSDLTISTDLGNTYQGATATIVVKIEVIQQEGTGQTAQTSDAAKTAFETVGTVSAAS
jgi:hypothetical protein